MLRGSQRGERHAAADSRSGAATRYKRGGPAEYESAGPVLSMAGQPATYSSISARTRFFTSSSAYDASTAARARSATPDSSRSSRSAAISYSLFRSVPNIGGSSELIVIVTPA